MIKSKGPEVNIKYLGGIENKEKWTSLTWSSTLMKIKDESGWYINIAIDFGMHQWWSEQDKLNEKINKEILKCDFLIITHAHMDHVWRLPMLVKKWFKWKIIMTNLTKQLAQIMLSDYVRLTEQSIKQVREHNIKLWIKIRKYLQILKLYNELSKWWLKRFVRTKKEDKLKQLIWLEVKNWWINSNSVRQKIKEIKEELKKNHIEKESDIKLIQKKEPELLYNLDDIYKTISFTETIKVWDELNLDNRIFITNLDDEKIFDLPKLLKSWYNKKIYILPHLKKTLLKKLKDKLDEIAKNNKKYKELIEKLQKTFNKKNKTQDDIDLLKSYDIKRKEDITKIKEGIIEFPYSYDDIKAIEDRLQIIIDKNKDNLLEEVKLRFHNAWHIEWSIQVTIDITTRKLINLLNKRWKNKNFKWTKQTKTETKNFWFSWDLWKISDPNISWTPDIPEYKYDFFQCESTYADTEHPYKKTEFDKFIKEINETKWKVLIPAFSLQRTQEILLELIQNKISKKELIQKHSKLTKNLKKLEKELQIINEEYNNKENIIDKYEYQITEITNEIMQTKIEINQIWEQVFLYNIIVDSPLSNKITDIFLNNLWEKYKLLDTKIQEKELWKQITTYLNERNEYKKLYTEKRKWKKDIIMSAWWMLQWGSIINHLKEIISDPDSKIIFTGYQAEWTLWRELLDWKKQVIIEWEIYDVRCKIVQIRWFSSHMWKKDLIDYLTKHLKLSNNSIISLNHWWDTREHLLYEINKIRPNQKVKIPKLWTKITIKL